jgi:KaiC/GvpD/RAD55 family RecA-like ATPase
MANFEMQLISRIIHRGDLHVALEWGITESDFRTAEGKGLWNLLCSYYADPSTKLSVLGPSAYKLAVPNIPLVADGTMQTEALCYELRKNRVEAEFRESCTELMDLVSVDQSAAVNAMHEKMSRLLSLGTTKNNDLSLSASLERTMQRYEFMKAHGASVNAKLLWPWHELNEETGGIQKDDYIVLYGRPKSMKTWVLSVILGWAFQQEKKVLIYTKEMTQDNIHMRAAACIAGIPYQEFRRGKLEPEEEQLLYSLASMCKDSGFDPICLNGRDAKGADTVGWVHSKVEKYKPDVVFIDGMYLLSTASNKKAANWERVTEISRGIREMILATEVPAICTMQANRGAAKHSNANLDEIAYADAIAQDATVAIRVVNEKASPTIALVFGGSREFKLHGIRIGGVPCTDFSFKEIMTEKEILKATQNDAPDEEDDPRAHAKKRGAVKKATKANGQEINQDAQVADQLKSVGLA